MFYSGYNITVIKLGLRDDMNF